ncbi:uncharacterized protein LOC122242282 [Penaeus japonicus]|uniref:uncharacterized protein LOC122242282 n=1 Tax=Penaeus japonicus TaxID=27405 RepID=UPI001C70CD7F|nr:uncharacterized protein LOC122242282 [Penaeus japonicus]
MFPFVYEVNATKKIAFRLLLVMYLYLAVFYAIPFVFAAYLFEASTCQYRKLLWTGYNTIILVGNVGVPLVGCVILNVPVFRTAFRQRRSQLSIANPPDEKSRVWEEFGLTVRTSLTFFTFLGMWSPFVIYKVIVLVTGSHVMIITQLVGILPFFTSAVNPILLGLKVSHLRTVADFTIFRFFDLCCCTPKERVEGEQEIESREVLPACEAAFVRGSSSLGFQPYYAKTFSSMSALETTTQNATSLKRPHSSASCIVLSPALLKNNNENNVNSVLSEFASSGPPRSSSSSNTERGRFVSVKSVWN